MLPTTFVLQIAVLVVFILALIAMGKLINAIIRLKDTVREALDRIRDSIHDKEFKIHKDG